jgi:hypothetical protein
MFRTTHVLKELMQQQKDGEEEEQQPGSWRAEKSDRIR